MLFIENPLIDLCVELKDTKLLEKYELEKGLTYLSDENKFPIYQELLENYKIEYYPGGASLNSCRGAKWMLKMKQCKDKCVYFGSIGKDKEGEKLKNILRENSIDYNFYEDSGVETGKCAALINEGERTMVTLVGAAAEYNILHLMNNFTSFKECRILYSTGFFILTNMDALEYVLSYANENEKLFVFNLAASFIVETKYDQILACVKSADIIICNEKEADAFSLKNKLESRTALVEYVCKMCPAKGKLPRVMIVTQGKKPVIVGVRGKDGSVAVGNYEIESIGDQLVDTVGAGDSFVSGFLAYYYLGNSVEKSVKAGIYLSREVCKHSGSTLPEVYDYQE